MAVASTKDSQRWIARDEKSAMIVPATTVTGIVAVLIHLHMQVLVFVTLFLAE